MSRNSIACWPAAAVTVLAAATVLADDLAGCRVIAEASARLACYDALSAGTPAPTPADLFGRDDASAAAELGSALGVAPPTRLDATVAAVDRTADGKLLLGLANGQVWQQVDTRRASLMAGATVRIRRAALGSYLLTTDADAAPLRVRRIR